MFESMKCALKLMAIYFLHQQNYQTSAETTRLEGLARGGKVQTAIDYCRVRNHLIMRVCLDNRQRAGAISNMTVRGVKGAKRVTADDGSPVWTMAVASHKTAASCGPATFGFDDNLHELLRDYIAKVRTTFVPISVDPEEGPLWLTLKGNKVSNKRISHCLQKAWRLNGHGEPVSTTILRKTAVSRTFELDPTLMPLLGEHMNHSPAVQKKYYLMSQKRNNTANMTAAIRRTAQHVSAGSDEAVELPEISIPDGPSVSVNTERRICVASKAGSTLPGASPTIPIADRSRFGMNNF